MVFFGRFFLIQFISVLLALLLLGVCQVEVKFVGRDLVRFAKYEAAYALVDIQKLSQFL